jgi:membrane-associated phospholipid phosphatase
MQPGEIDWNSELAVVEQTMQNLTPQEIQSAQYWAAGELTERFTNLIYQYAGKYRIGSPNCARILGFFHASMNDVFVITWYLKYQWDVARPNQYGRNIRKLMDTPRFPAYPSAHACLAGAAEVLMCFYFPQEAVRIQSIINVCAQSRLYAGVHFKVDNDEGLRLGRQIGEIAVEVMKAQI